MLCKSATCDNILLKRAQKKSYYIDWQHAFDIFLSTAVDPVIKNEI